MTVDAPSRPGASRERGDLDVLAARYGPGASVTVVALALVLRLPGLFGWWVNPDEGIYFAVLTQERFSLFWSEVFATAHPPLYFLILRAMGWLGTDLAWLRSLALASGCAAVWVFILVGRDIAGSSATGWITGLAAGLLLAVSPAAIALSQVIRPYMLLVLLLALALLFLLRYLERPSQRLLVLYALCASLAALLHYSAALALGVLVMLVAADGITRGTGRPEWRRIVAIQAIPVAIVGALYLLQMRRLMNSGVAEFSVETWLSDYLIDTPVDAWLGLVGFHAALVGTTASVSAAFVTLIAMAWAAAGGKRELVVSMGGALLIATACAGLRLYPFGAARHSAWLIPFVTPGLAWVAGSLAARGGRVRARGLVVAGAVVAGLLLGPPLGAERAAPILPEQVLRTEHVGAMSNALDPERGPPVLVMSVETYRLLLPLYSGERQGARMSADGTYTHFRWGTRRVIVLPGLDIAVRRDQMDQPNHLYTGTRRAAEELDVPLPRSGETVMVVSGDWRGGVFDLAELARREGLSGETQIVPGLIAVSLDLETYGRALQDGGS